MTSSAKPVIDEALTRRVADLARLKLTQEEIATFTQQLSNILGYVDELQAIDITGVEPLTHPIELETALRPDEAKKFAPDQKEKILEAAPETLHGGYKVPQII